MAVKSVLVRLRGENSDLNRALLGSAAASKTLGKNLDDADKSSRRLSDGLEISNDRTTMLVQSALALGPALVPLGAQAVPVIMGLGTQMGFAAGAAGVAVLAFQGVGDSLKAVNQYALEPTATNLAKMQEEMDKLGPAGRDFVHYLQELRPRLQVFQDLAQEGMLPGFEEGIDSLLTRMPQLERIVTTIATTVGDLMSDAGADLGGSEWQAFFDYIEGDAKPILTDMLRTLGNFSLGMANTVAAFGPLTRDFSDGFLGMSRDFEEWSENLASSAGFHDFVSYLQDTGPAVLDTLGALADATLAIVEAAAPVGKVALPIIEALADVISGIARTPAGPVLIGVAAGISAVSRAIALYQAANGSALLGAMMGRPGADGAAGNGAASTPGLMDRTFNVSSIRSTLPAIKEYSAAMGELSVTQRAAAVAQTQYLGTMTSLSKSTELAPGHHAREQQRVTDQLVAANERHAAAAERVATAEAEKKAAIRQSAIGIGKTTALVGGLAVATSGYAEKTGLANTASLALMGTMAGPWGAAIGAGVGLTMDLAASNNTLEDSFKSLEMAMAGATPTASGAASFDAQLASTQGQFDKFQSEINEYDELGGDWRWQVANPLQSYAGAKNTIEGWAGKSDVEEYQEALDEASAAAEENRLAAMDAAIANNVYQGAVSAAGIAAGLGRAEVRGLTVAMQEQTKAALGAFDAETAYRQALKAARAQGEKSNAGIRGNTDAALQNRSALGQLAGAWNNQSDAVKNNVARFRAAKGAFIETAVAMGVPERAARALANRLLQIPKQRVIDIAMRGDAEAIAAINRIKAEMAGIHDKTVRLTYYVNQVNTAGRQSQGGRDGDPSTPYWSGGFTGWGGKYEPAGVVHRKEVVLPEEIVTRDAKFLKDRYGYLPGMNELPGYAGGGYVRAPQPQPAYARATAGAVAVSPQSLAGLRIEGAVTINGLEGHIRGTVREEIDADRDFDRIVRGG